MAVPTQLSLYNGACRLLRQSPLATTSDDVEVRYRLDDCWNDEARDYTLEQGLWLFARRTSQFDFDPAYTASFGYQYRFEKPTDWIRTAMAASDQYFAVPITAISDEAGSWFCDTTPLYIQYISNDPAYGYDMARWPETFVKYFEAYLAQQTCRQLTSSKEIVDDIEKVYHHRLIDARSKSAMNESAAFPPMGMWIRSRRGRHAVQDRGGNSSLIG